MNIFDFRNNLVGDYASYVRSFIRIRDHNIDRVVTTSLEDGRLWPEPLLQLNPNFEPGGSIDELIEGGVLHPTCGSIFRIDKSDENTVGSSLRLHQHQRQAIDIATSGNPFVVTTGTGSGKSLTYIIPIIDHVLKHGSGNGIQAIIVYPMNALANSQEGELRKFLTHGFPKDDPPVTFRRYTGQEGREARNEILVDPPDILLTNYVMLELLLTRPQEKGLIDAAKGLRYLVFDEIHTYRGRQGADVAMLIRRAREYFGASGIQCVGTSATMSSGGSVKNKQQVVANVTSRIFGVEISPDHVVGETLRRVTPAIDFTNDNAALTQLKAAVKDSKALDNLSYEDFVTSPLASWIETKFGLEVEDSAENGAKPLIRTTPKRISGEDGVAADLADLTGFDQKICEQALQSALLSGYRKSDPNTGRRAFAFRLHQFLSKGDAIYASAEKPDSRHITLDGQQYVPGSNRNKVLLPLAFCRECGHEYYTVWLNREPASDEIVRLTPRQLSQTKPEESNLEPGFLYFSDEKPWPTAESSEEYERLPDDWLELTGTNLKLKYHHRKKRPQEVRVDPEGMVGMGGMTAHIVAAPFRFCLCCGVMYPGRQGDYSKLNVFSSEGRATSTTILSLSAVRQLQDKAYDLPLSARKLLSFTDNRQDAALQAGHFNDFVQIGLLRSALCRAVIQAGEDGIENQDITKRVFDVMRLEFAEYAQNPDMFEGARRRVHEALREVLGYRLYQDLKRGWRVTSPNLEQVGLLTIRYHSLEDFCADDRYWQEIHPALVGATHVQRQRVSQVLIDTMRKQLSIRTQYLDSEYQETIRNKSYQRLKEPWAFDPRERFEYAAVTYPRSRRENDHREAFFLSARGGFGRFLRRSDTFPHLSEVPGLEETDQIIRDLLRTLHRAALVEEVKAPRNEEDVAGYQVNADAMIWCVGDGTAGTDPLSTVNIPEDERTANRFFSTFYRELAAQLSGIEAKEHTAQVSNSDREERERAFRVGELPVLYCSPTMELGVDIKSLNVVNLRNVPPTPANYAQRSGRAGRSGQPALVFTYCSSWNSHDQYFFKRQEEMVAGVVEAPRLDLSNEELIRSHVHAVWLAETGADLKSSLSEILDLSSEGLPLVTNIAHDFARPSARAQALVRTRRVLSDISADLESSPWHHDSWLAETLDRAAISFERACGRWRDLYLAALEQIDTQNAIIRDASAEPKRREQAERIRGEAVRQRDLLIRSESGVYSDFYSYRYFASEGFLPGYSFPRLPMTAYVPGQYRKNDEGEYLSRPRFLAISEFGPRAFVYHDGGKYRVNRVLFTPGSGGQADVVAKRCNTCGYLHTDGGQDVCESCGAELPHAMDSLLRLQNVSTKRVERINSDEEERQRLGYEITTAIRYRNESNDLTHRYAEVQGTKGSIATLTYGQATTLWRINLGWRHRKDKQQHGFVLDLERGYWENDSALEQRDDILSDEDPLSERIKRVIPYVEDRRNSLVWKPTHSLEENKMASLQAALKNAVQTLYQLEDNELAAEPLPDSTNRNALLFYESAEGGAGVLRQIVDEADAIVRVARMALELCHFDPDTGDDTGGRLAGGERCESACYDCLMSYSNQRDHLLLDRFSIRELLLELASAKVEASPGSMPRAQHLMHLRRLTESDLEREFLDLLEREGRRLPSHAQYTIDLPDGSSTRVDFFDEAHRLVIHIDGPYHDAPHRQEDDVRIDAGLGDLGLVPLRFHYTRKRTWSDLMNEHAYAFGEAQTQEPK